MIRTPDFFETAIELDLDDDAIVHLFVRDSLVQLEHACGPTPWRAFRELGLQPSRVQPIGRHRGRSHLAVALSDDAAADVLPAGCRAAGLRSWFGVLDDDTLAIAMR